MSTPASLMDWIRLTGATRFWLSDRGEWVFTDTRNVSSIEKADEEVSFRDLCLDSRKVSNGDIYVALKGTQVDGHRFIGDAIGHGAALVLCESEEMPSQEFASHGVPVLTIPHLRAELGRISQAYYGNPSQKLSITAVTGTNGKTTISTLIWQGLLELGIKAGLLGTVGGFIGKHTLELPAGSNHMTTSDAIQLARWMRLMVDEGVTHLVMEASSHALDQGRLNGVPVAVAVYSNLSHEHLDYHGTMEEYAKAKKRLFDGLSDQSFAIVNGSDAWGTTMVKDSSAQVWIVRYSEDSGSGSVSDAGADSGTESRFVIASKSKQSFTLRYTDVDPLQGGGLHIDLGHDDSDEFLSVSSPLQGKFNAMNVSQACLALQALGWKFAMAASALSKATGAPGRMEKVQSGHSDEPLVLVDYAHTPDALEKVASATADLVRHSGYGGKLWIVFGCGGERDRLKRPVMAEIAQRFADHVIVTADNPRHEDPESILDEICTGFDPNGSPFERISDRVDAIHKAVLNADSEDIILIAGKGHETGQIIAGKTVPLDDREEALKALHLRAQKMEEV